MSAEIFRIINCNLVLISVIKFHYFCNFLNFLFPTLSDAAGWEQLLCPAQTVPHHLSQFYLIETAACVCTVLYCGAGGALDDLSISELYDGNKSRKSSGFSESTKSRSCSGIDGDKSRWGQCFNNVVCWDPAWQTTLQ